MIFSLIFLFLMFNFDGVYSNYIAYSIYDYSWFSTSFSVIALVLIYPLFNNDKKYLITATVFGLLYDIVYTNTFIFYAVIFFLIAFLIKFINVFLSPNILNYNIISLISVIIFYSFSYFLLVILGYINFDFHILLIKLVSVLPMSLIVSLILSTIITILTKKKILKTVK